MAEAGAFTIQELRTVGVTQGQPGLPGSGETFEWTSDRRPQHPARGGARAAPLQPWTMTGRLRTIRTDYPGATTPSEQVLGPNHGPFTLRGRFDDRYNFAGFATAERARLEAMCRRGNLCRFQFQDQVFLGLITEWVFHYRRDWEIHYELTVSVHDRPENFSLAGRAPATKKSPSEHFDDLELETLAMQATHDERPASALKGDLSDQVGAALNSQTNTKSALGDILDQRELEPARRASDPFRRLATQFRQARSDALNVVGKLIQVRSDVELSIQSAMTVLDFENWARSLRFQARVVMGTSSTAAREVESRADPDAQALYRPHRGESLYNVSRRFYGTPFAWRLIADRNALTDIVLTGEELLIIPERGEG